MSGQPAGAFDVTGVTFTEVGGVAPPNIIGVGRGFTITVDFKGDPADPIFGAWWTGMTGLKLPYIVTVYYESIGGAPEGTLATIGGDLVPGKHVYAQTLSVPAGSPLALPEGLYQVAATVRIPAFPTWVGFKQDTFIQVSAGA